MDNMRTVNNDITSFVTGVEQINSKALEIAESCNKQAVFYKVIIRISTHVWCAVEFFLITELIILLFLDLSKRTFRSETSSFWHLEDILKKIISKLAQHCLKFQAWMWIFMTSSVKLGNTVDSRRYVGLCLVNNTIDIWWRTLGL